MPYFVLSDEKKIRIFKTVEKDEPVDMELRSWDLFEYPMLPTIKKHAWAVRTSSQL